MDVLTLGGIIFENAKYMTPDKLPFGGSQAINIHKLPGGSRVYDILGPDEGDINFSGFILDQAAFQIAVALDSLRAQGNLLSLSFAGTTRQVFIKNFGAGIRRYPNWVEYTVNCSVASNPLLGTLSVGTGNPGTAINSLVSSDIAAAIALLSTQSPNIQAAIGILGTALSGVVPTNIGGGNN